MKIFILEKDGKASSLKLKKQKVQKTVYASFERLRQDALVKAFADPNIATSDCPKPLKFTNKHIAGSLCASSKRGLELKKAKKREILETIGIFNKFTCKLCKKNQLLCRAGGYDRRAPRRAEKQSAIFCRGAAGSGKSEDCFYASECDTEKIFA